MSFEHNAFSYMFSLIDIHKYVCMDKIHTQYMLTPEHLQPSFFRCSRKNELNCHFSTTTRQQRNLRVELNPFFRIQGRSVATWVAPSSCYVVWQYDRVTTDNSYKQSFLFCFDSGPGGQGGWLVQSKHRTIWTLTSSKIGIDLPYMKPMPQKC